MKVPGRSFRDYMQHEVLCRKITARGWDVAVHIPGWVWLSLASGGAGGAHPGEKEAQGAPDHFDNSLTGGCRQVEVDLFSKRKGQGKRKLPAEV